MISSLEDHLLSLLRLTGGAIWSSMCGRSGQSRRHAGLEGQVCGFRSEALGWAAWESVGRLAEYASSFGWIRWVAID